jgi:hypothetical protein
VKIHEVPEIAGIRKTVPSRGINITPVLEDWSTLKKNAQFNLNTQRHQIQSRLQWQYLELHLICARRQPLEVASKENFLRILHIISF